MPPKRTYRRKKKVIRRRRRVYKKASVPRQLRPRTYRFKRDIEETLLLSGTSPPDGWTGNSSFNRIYRNFAWSLSQVGDSTDFTNLFRQYRILGARVKLMFSTTQSTTNPLNNFTNSQLLIRMAPNQRGTTPMVLNDAYWQSIQAKKYRLAFNGGRPIDIYMPLKQLTEIATGNSGTTNTMTRPKFVTTQDLSAAFYGINMSIERVDGQALSGTNANYQYCKSITTLYFECRGVE